MAGISYHQALGVLKTERSWLKRRGIDSERLERMGRGSYGVVFVYKNKAVKVTNDATEITCLLKIKITHRLKRHKRIAKYHAWKETQGGLFVIVMERLDSRLDCTWQENLFDLRESYAASKNGKLLCDINAEELISFSGDDIGQKFKLFIRDWLEIEKIERDYFNGCCDLHNKNVCYDKNGRLKLIDASIH